MIKTIGLTLVLMSVLNFNASSQTKGSAKIFGYVQSVSGGASPDRSESPGQQNNQGGGTNYYIYLTLSTASRIYPSEMWINGDLYSIQAIAIAKTPVVMETINVGETESRVLVPKTKQKVMQLVPAASSGAKATAKAKKLANTNDVVVVYKLGGKFYYTTLKKLTRLETAAMQ